VISTSDAERYAEPLAAIYRDAELRILNTITQALAEGVDAPSWEQLQLGRMQRVRKLAVAELETVNAAAAVEIQRALNSAYSDGAASAFADAAGVLDPIEALPAQRIAAVKRLTAATIDGLSSAENAMLRSVDDVYRAVVAQSVAGVVAGDVTRRAATQSAIDQFLSKGITAVQTRRGKMDIATYSTMAMRTAAARSTLEGHTETMGELGLDLVTINPGPRPCDICDKWASKLLAVRGPVGRLELKDLAGEGTVSVVVDATLDEARSDGFGHPNDRCNLKSFMPGISTKEDLKRPPWDEDGYRAQQGQRANERQIRAWKTREATSIDPRRAAEARQNVKHWQQVQRDHMDANPFLKRQSKREQIGGIFSGNERTAVDLRQLDQFSPTAKAIKAASSTPLLDKLPKLKRAETLGDATKGLTANPGNGLDDLYGVNCTYVVAAAEMRARGLDVIARPLDLSQSAGGGGRSLVQVRTEWRSTLNPGAEFVYYKGGRRGLDKGLIEDWPDGARGFVNIEWRGGGAHIFNVGKVDGKVVYYDGQRSAPDIDGYFASRKNGTGFFVMRTDDLELTEELNDLVYAADGPEAIKLAQDQAAKAASSAKLKADAQAKIAAAKAAEAAGDLPIFQAEVDKLQDNLKKARELFGDDDAAPPIARLLSRLKVAEESLDEARKRSSS
jgi:hypothetical protein